jgi:amino acid transporter
MGQNGQEDEKERRDRELIELLNELRLAMPGVQMLFAFLLIVPFSNGFPKMSDIQRDVYFVAFLCAAAAMLLLIAPSIHHRLRFREKDKERLLLRANRMAIIGLGFLAFAVAAVVFVITDVLFSTPWPAVVAAIVAGAFVWMWFVVPLMWKVNGKEASAPEQQEHDRRVMAEASSDDH